MSARAHGCSHVQIDVVLSFHNGGDEALNVSGVMGSINSPAAFNIYVNNLTAMVRLEPCVYSPIPYFQGPCPYACAHTGPNSRHNP